MDLSEAFAVMHNGCTTALEATISEKPIVTYIPFKQEYAQTFRTSSVSELSTGAYLKRSIVCLTALGRL